MRAKIAWQEKSREERLAIIARRDKEKARAADRARYYRHREDRLARMKDWALRNPERARELNREWQERNPEKRAAQVAVGNAVRDGKLVRQPCEVCGNPKSDGHHDDYSKPLEVRWLCRTHHMEHHRVYEVEAA
jgi:hypothetical protein